VASVLAQLSVRRGRAAVEFYKAAFGAVEVYRVGGTDEHESVVAQLAVDGGGFWVSDESPEHLHFSPESLGGSTTRLLLVVDDPVAAAERAVAAGAKEVYPVAEGHGWLLGRVEDPFGHQWEIGKPLVPWPPPSGRPEPAGVHGPWVQAAGGYDRAMPDRLYFTDSDEANELLASDPMALLIGFVLDQQVSVQKAFSGPLVLRERLGAIDASALASADLEPVFRERPAIHRFPGSMAQRVHDVAVHVRDHYDGDAARVWTDAADADALRSNLAALPGFGEMKIKALGAVLAKRFDVAVAAELVPWHPTLGDVDSPQALADYQAAKRVHKAEWSKARARS
jgi:uncharacterized HhH-GPD family protein